MYSNSNSKKNPVAIRKKSTDCNWKRFCSDSSIYRRSHNGAHQFRYEFTGRAGKVGSRVYDNLWECEAALAKAKRLYSDDAEERREATNERKSADYLKSS